MELKKTLDFCSVSVGLYEKWSTIDPKYFHAIAFQKLVFLVSLYPESFF